MFYIEKIASESTINLEDRNHCESMMARLYDEDPSKWPHGLHMSGFDGGVFMVREASTGNPVGFTGWQERRADSGEKVGYYSIGILPEYRRNGYAKAAVANLLREKSARVDRVEAFIAPHNTPSIALAQSLGVDIVSEPTAKRAGIAGKVLGNAAAGLGIAGGMDVLTHGRGLSPSEYWDSLKHMDMSRMGNFAFNTALGGGSLGAIRSGQEGLKTVGTYGLLAIPSKDVALQATGEMPKAREALETAAKNLAPQPGMSNKTKLLLGALGLVGAGGLGALMHRGNKATESLANATRSSAGGRVQLTLPTKDPGDVETQVTLPLEELMLSKNIQQSLSRDTRRRLRDESKERTQKRPPAGKKPKEREEEPDNVVSMPKAAAYVASLRRVQNLL
jgi:RimJ/RimL family protein N-acetyltransferase